MECRFGVKIEDIVIYLTGVQGPEMLLNINRNVLREVVSSSEVNAHAVLPLLAISP